MSITSLQPAVIPSSPLVCSVCLQAPTHVAAPCRDRLSQAQAAAVGCGWAAGGRRPVLGSGRDRGKGCRRPIGSGDGSWTAVPRWGCKAWIGASHRDLGGDVPFGSLF